MKSKVTLFSKGTKMAGQTVILAAIDGDLIGLIAIADKVKVFILIYIL